MVPVRQVLGADPYRGLNFGSRSLNTAIAGGPSRVEVQGRPLLFQTHLRLRGNSMKPSKLYEALHALIGVELSSDLTSEIENRKCYVTNRSEYETKADDELQTMMLEVLCPGGVIR